MLGTIVLACGDRRRAKGGVGAVVGLTGAAVLKAVTLGRGILGAFFTELYPELRTPHPLNVAAAILQHVALALITMALLAAWHEEATGSLQHPAPGK